MIENSSSMDRKVAPPKGLTRGRAIALAGTIALAILAAILFPSIRRWSRADRSVDATTMSIAAVTRGDLRRDVADRHNARGRFLPAEDVCHRESDGERHPLIEEVAKRAADDVEIEAAEHRSYFPAM